MSGTTHLVPAWVPYFAIAECPSSALDTSKVAAQGEETVRLIGEAGGTTAFIEADVSDAGEVEALVGGGVEPFGRLDGAVTTPLG